MVKAMNKKIFITGVICVHMSWCSTCVARVLALRCSGFKAFVDKRILTSTKVPTSWREFFFALAATQRCCLCSAVSWAVDLASRNEFVVKLILTNGYFAHKLLATSVVVLAASWYLSNILNGGKFYVVLHVTIMDVLRCRVIIRVTRVVGQRLSTENTALRWICFPW